MGKRLDGCWLKIERAKEHRDSLQTYVFETLGVIDNLPRVGIKFDSQTGEHVVYVSQVPDLRDFIDRVKVVVGEIAHHLISALNYLAYELAMLHTGGDVKFPNRVDFPISDTPERFEEFAKRSLKEIAPAHAAIIERYQGYHRIDDPHNVPNYIHPLSTLRDLNSTDKHRMPICLVIPTYAIMAFAGPLNDMMFEIGKRAPPLSECRDPPAELGAEIMRAKLPAAMVYADMNMAGYTAPVIALSSGHPVINTLDDIAAVVVKLIREFEPVF